MNPSEKKYTVLDVLKLMTRFLEEKGIENPRLNAELLAGKVFNLERVQLYLNYERPVSPDELSGLRELLRRRGNHEPLQYLLGRTEFYSLPFDVSPEVLIPRPETEILVDFIIQNCENYFKSEDKIQILDIGTGSGNIAVSLAANISNCEITAVDVNDGALALARRNAEKNNVQEKITFLKANIFDQVPESFMQHHIVAANLPYISANEMKQLPLEVRDFEPRQALYGGQDGLDYFRKFNGILNKILAPNGLFALEIGAGQAESVSQIFAENDVVKDQGIIHDLNNLPRVFWGKV